MKLSDMERRELIGRIADARAASKLTDADLGRATGVHPSQVGRICRGEFRTVSSNVVQVCTTLGLAVRTVELPKAAEDAAWSKLEASVLRAWDRTPQGADKLARIMEAVADIRRAGSENR